MLDARIFNLFCFSGISKTFIQKSSVFYSFKVLHAKGFAIINKENATSLQELSTIPW